MGKMIFLSVALSVLTGMTSFLCHASTLLEQIAAHSRVNMRHVPDTEKNMYRATRVTSQAILQQKMALTPPTVRANAPPPPPTLESHRNHVLRQIKAPPTLRPLEEGQAYSLIPEGIKNTVRQNTLPDLELEFARTRSQIQHYRELMSTKTQEKASLQIRIQNIEEAQRLMCDPLVQEVLKNQEVPRTLQARQLCTRLGEVQKKIGSSEDVEGMEVLLSRYRVLLIEAHEHIGVFKCFLEEFEKKSRFLQRTIATFDLKSQKIHENKQEVLKEICQSVTLRQAPVLVEKDPLSCLKIQGGLCLIQAQKDSQIQELVAQGYQLVNNTCKGVELMAPAQGARPLELRQVETIKKRLQDLSATYGWEPLPTPTLRAPSHMMASVDLSDVMGSMIVVSPHFSQFYQQDEEDSKAASSVQGESLPTPGWHEYFTSFIKGRTGVNARSSLEEATHSHGWWW